MPTNITPAQEIVTKIKTLQSKVGDMQEDVRLTSVLDTIEDIQSTIRGLPQRLVSLRTRGYVFEKNLETDAQVLEESWNILYPGLQAQIRTQSISLVNALRPIESQIPQLVSLSSNPMAARNLYNPIEAATNQLESKVSATKEMIEGMYDKINTQVSTLSRHIDEVEFLLKNLAEATFKLLPTESGIMAVKAVWFRIGKEQKGDPEGILFLTDQRLLFEQKEQIATKKVLFITTEKQKVQNLLFEIPVALVDKVSTSKTGMLKNEDHIDIVYQYGAPLAQTHFHIWQDCATWQGLINRARTKDFEAGRAITIDQAVIDKVRAAPTQCPSCGGAITKPVLRGQDTIKCEFCGFEIRL
jgi:hypothetical protein